MKVCFIDWFAYSLFNPQSDIVFGGAQIQLYLLAREIANNQKNSVSFLTDNQLNNQTEIFNRIKVYQLLRSPNWLGYWYFFVRLLVQLKKINAQIYFQRAASAETGLIALICKIFHKKFIFMVAHQQDVNGSFVVQKGWQGKLYLLGLRLANKIICQTLDQQVQLSQSLKQKSIVVASGYPIKSPKKISKQGILWAARAEIWKQPKLFIELAKQFPQEKFTMICPPAENEPNYFKIIAAQAKKVPNLKFIKFIPFQAIDSYFASTKIFISTSLSEGFPNTFIQAAKNMTPIISFQVNPDNIINQYQLGFCADGNEKQMTIFLKKMLTNEPLRKKLAASAYRYARKYHNIKQTASNIISNIF